MRKKLSPWAHGELTVTTVVTAPGPMITAQSRLGEITAQWRRGHSSVTARSQLSHGVVTAQSRHFQYDHGSVTARSQLNHGPGQGSVTAGCDHFGHRELTVSSWWAHSEQSRWPIFFSWAFVWENLGWYWNMPWPGISRDFPGLDQPGTTTWDFPGATWDMGLAKSQVGPGYLGKPGTLNQRPGTYLGQPGTLNQRPGTYLRQPGTLNQRPETYLGQPGTLNQRPGTYLGQPGTLNQRPGTYLGQPGTLNQRPGTYLGQPGTLNQRPGTYLGQPGTLNQRPGITWDFWNIERNTGLQMAWSILTWIAPIIKSDIMNHIIHFNILYYIIKKLWNGATKPTNHGTRLVKKRFPDDNSVILTASCNHDNYLIHLIST